MDKLTQGVIDRRTVVKGGLTAGALAALAGCGGTNGAQDENRKTRTDIVLNAVLYDNPKCIDPYNTSEEMGATVVRCLFSPLTQYDFKTAQIKPCVCTKWEVNDRADLFTFHLVPGSKFHNGEVVDAQAFKRAWERIINPKTSRGPSSISFHLSCVEGYKDLLEGRATDLSGVTCPDANTLVVKLSSPFSDFPHVVAYASLAPVPKVALEDPAAFWRAPVGNGPFQMDGVWEDGQYIRVKRFDGYYASKPTLAGIHFRIVKEVATAFNEFKAANLDIAKIPVHEMEKTIADYGVSDDKYTMLPGKRVLLGEMCKTAYIFFNTKDPVMANVNVRRALSLAINREAICETVYKGRLSSADDIVPPSIVGYESGIWKYARYDRAEAEKLLDIDYPKDASGKRNLEITLSCSTFDDSETKARFESIAGDWEKLGLTVKLSPSEWATYLSDVKDGKCQIGFLAWSADYPTTDSFLYSLFYTGAGGNHSFYSNLSVDTLILKARGEVDENKRLTMLREANAIIAEEVPVTPFSFSKMASVGSKRIKHLYMNPFGHVDWVSVEIVD